MSPALRQHPSIDELHRFGTGQLDAGPLETISAHLETCVECRQSLATQTGDTLESLVRSVGVSALDRTQAPDATADSDPVLTRLGDYRIVRVLGEGGMGTVYEAEDERLKRRVALKVMKAALAARPEAKARFLREAQSVAALDHDHIVAIFQVGEEDGVPFLAMPLLRGASLEDRLRSGETFTVAQILSLGRQIAEGLAAAHERGLIHRDIKPANLWLESTPGRAGDEFRVKILDFGLARLEADNTQLTTSGTIVGTPAYMAPEQARGAGIDSRADLFSLGCVLYRLCTGTMPFRGDSTMALLMSLASDHPTAPRSLNPAIPTALSDLTLRLLAKTPADRPASARAVVDALAACPLADPVQPPPRRRSLWPVAAACAFVGLLALAGIVFFWQTPDGVVRIECDDPAIKIAFDEGELKVVGAYKEPLSLKPGKHGLKIQRGDFEFETDKLVVNRGDKVVLKIEATAGKVQVVQAGKGVLGEKDVPMTVTGPPTDAERRAAERALALGAVVRVDGKGLEIRTAAELPKTPFILTNLYFPVDSKVTDAELAIFKDFTGVTHLGFEGCPMVTDAGLANFRNCKDLLHFNVNSTRITDAGLAHFKDCKKISHLGLSINTKVTDSGLAHFANCKEMYILHLGKTAITDAGLATFKDCEKLWLLDLDDTNVTDTGLAHLKDCKRLGSLNLAGTKVTDAGLVHLKDCKLNNLTLNQTAVTDAGLDHLKGHSGLTALQLHKTKVTADGVRALSLALPKCRIEWDGGFIEPKSDNSLLFDGMNFIELPLQMDPKSLFTFEGYFVPRGIQAGHWLTMDGLPAITIDASKNWAFKVTTPKQTTEHASNVKPADWQRAHVALVADAKEIRLYINGILAKSAPRPADMVLPAASGKMILAGNFAGTVDEIRISKTPRYGKDFIPDERFTPDADTLALYHCDEGKGHVLGDSSGNGNHGRAIAPKWRMANGQEKIIAAPLTAAQRKSLEFLFSVGGSITYPGQGWMNPRKMEDLPNGPVRIESISVDHIPGHKINGEGRPITDKDIPFLRDLPPTKGFVLASTANHLSLQGLESLTKLPLMASVEKFWLLGGKEPLGPSFKYLANLGSLNYLAVHGLQPEDSTYLSDLAASPNLQVLDISYSRIREFHRLKALPQLRYLGFSHEVNMNFNAADVAELTQLRKLASHGGDISDPSLEHLGRMTSLEWLHLHGTAITDKGLEHLQKMAGLTFLELGATKVTEAGVKKLAAALPRCKIAWEGGVIEPRAMTFAPLDPAWQAKVQTLKLEEQVKEVATELKRRNPGFDGTVSHAELEGGAGTGFHLCVDEVTDLTPVRALSNVKGLFLWVSKDKKSRLADLSPLKGLPLAVLEFGQNQVADLSPLEGMKLIHLSCSWTPVADLTPLRTMPLKYLSVMHTKVADLTPLRGMPLEVLHCWGAPIRDLSPLTGMPLTILGLGETRVNDLAPLKGMKLKNLHFYGTEVRDLAALAGMPLTEVSFSGTPIASLEPLKGMKLSWLSCSNTQVTDLSPLRGMPLEFLDLNNMKVTDASLAVLAECAALKSLNLGSTAITDEGLKHLPGLKNLTTLALRKTNVTEAGVKAIAKAFPQCKIEWDGSVIEPKPVIGLAPLTDAQRKSLEFVLSVGGHFYVQGKPVIAKVEDMPKDAVQMESIAFEYQPGHTPAGRPLTDKDLDQLRDLPPIRDFQVIFGTAHRLTPRGIEALIQLPFMATVENFGLSSSNEPVGPVLKSLKDLRSVTVLRLGLRPEDGLYLGDLAGIPNLTTLEVSYSKTTDLHRLKALPKLRTLSYSHEVNAEANAAGFAELTQLHKLILHGTDLTDTGLEKIGRMNSLAELSLHNSTKFTDRGLEHLSGMAGLTFLQLGATKVTDAGVKKLAAALPKCKIDWDGGVIEPTVKGK